MKKNEFVKNVTEIVRSYVDGDGEQIFDVTLKETDAYLSAVKEAIITAMGKGEEVSWPGFMKFTVADVAARTSRNPRTGEAVEVPAKKKVKTKILGDLKKAV